MLKYFFLLICALSAFNSAYLPYKKNKDFPDDTCFYPYKDNSYVKDCENGKYCKDRDEGLSRCENIPSEVILSSLEEACTSDFECETNLICTNSKCLLPSGTSCNAGEEIVRTQSGYECKEIATKNYFYTKDFTWTRTVGHSNGLDGQIDGTVYMDASDPEYLKVKGKITDWNITSNTNGKLYEPTKIVYSDIGTVDDGEFVFDEKACKSGFALYFYGDGELKNPYDNNNYNYMYKKCVTLEEVENIPNSFCKIRYNLGGKSLTYNVNKIGAKTISETCNREMDSYYRQIINNCFTTISKNDLCRENLKIKIDIFQKYIGELTDDIRKCTNPEINRPEINGNRAIETCRNNQLRKWAYFYESPDEYALYHTDEDKGKTVVNYLVQTKYPSYQSNSFLQIKYFICLFLLISLF
jgi:hypothetical protein